MLCLIWYVASDHTNNMISAKYIKENTSVILYCKGMYKKLNKQNFIDYLTGVNAILRNNNFLDRQTIFVKGY